MFELDSYYIKKFIEQKNYKGNDQAPIDYSEITPRERAVESEEHLLLDRTGENPVEKEIFKDIWKQKGSR